MTLTEEQVTELSSKAQSGDADAKEILTGLGRDTAPAKADANTDKNDATQTSEAEGGAGKAGTLAETDPNADKGNGGADTRRNRDGADQRPSKIDTIRELRRERRELRTQLEEMRKHDTTYAEKLAALEARLNAPVNGKKEGTEPDILTKLLSTPEELLSGREKALMERVEKLISERVGQVPNMLKGMREKSDAVKTLGEIKDFDLDKDEDEVYQIMEEEYGFSEEEVVGLLEARPTRTAQLIKRAWEKHHVLDDGKKADKSAAASSAVGGSPALAKPNLKDLNLRAKNAKTPEELEKVIREIESFTTSE